MKFNNDMLRLYAVTDRHWTGEQTLYEQVRDVLMGGATCLQLREKDLDEASFYEEAKNIKELCRLFDVPFIINDNVMLAKKIDADGVHVGQDDMACAKAREILGPDKIIGVSAHTIEEARIAKEQGADYLGVGAIFPTSSKDDAEVLGIKRLKEMTETVDLPMVAIGGISYDNCLLLKDTGIDGIAVISALFGQKHIKQATIDLKKRVDALYETMHTCLTIAGSDSSGGAGIQADLKTMLANKVFGMSAITALTAQNTTGVTDIMDVTPEFLESQIRAVFDDIYPEAVKIGMVSSKALIHTIVEMLKHYDAKHIVVDPVMVATSGAKLISGEAISTLKEELLPIAEVITPNIPETEVLTNMEVKTVEDMEIAAKKIYDTYHCAVLVKGGHQLNDANDYLYNGEKGTWFKGHRIDNSNTHGTGCTLSSAIASNLAKGYTLEESVRHAKTYLSGAIGAMLDLGQGSGPMDHGYNI